ncbi:di/tricarboxylate transporter [Alkalibacillus flavidus]|uniref:Di/tricarboxylate transporter n=1 Tax=Alkalibacillus flavidus TaxID=546021 RepID=A0ABV2KVT1_9BACI
MLNILKSNRAVLLIWAVMIGGFVFAKLTVLEPLASNQQYTLLVLVIAIYLWTLSTMPQGASSIFVLALMIALGVVDEPDQAFQGFLTSGLYFIVLLSLISQVLVTVGLDQTIASWFQRFSGGHLGRIIISLPILMILLPIFLPSAVARYKILAPLITKMNELNGLGHDSLFHKFGLFVISFLNQKGTFIVFTGGGFSVIAYQLMVEYGVVNVQWLEWIGIMAPPLLVMAVLSSIAVWLYLKAKTNAPYEMTDTNYRSINQTDDKYNRHPQFRIVVLAFVAMVSAWIVTDPEAVPIILPPMAMIVFLALPSIGLVDNQLIRQFDWETFLLLGASFSLGFIMADNGTADVIAQGLLQLVPSDLNSVLMVGLIVIFIVLLRMMFTNGSSAIVVIFPIVMSYADFVNVSHVALAFLTMMVVGGMILIPIHAPTTYYASLAGVFSKGEQWVVAMISTSVTSVVAIIAAFLYW